MTAPNDKVLLVTGSIRGEDSTSTALARRIAERLAPEGFATRDVTRGIDMIDAAFLGATFTPPEGRTPEQAQIAAFADSLVEEVKGADTLVIALPVYNFGPSAQLKAWADHICRAGVTFRYTESGPEGLLKGRAYIAVASGGTRAGSEIDFASTWLKQVLGFIGFEIAGVIAADQQSTAPGSEKEAFALAETMDLAAA